MASGAPACTMMTWWPTEREALVAYLQRQSLWFDIRISWLTFVKVLKRDGVSH